MEWKRRRRSKSKCMIRRKRIGRSMNRSLRRKMRRKGA
jgi:hypothetical protein